MATVVGADVPPKQTIYINNINEGVKKDELKKSLYDVFSQFGKILDIVALKTLRLRGQAWVVFDDVASATNALRQMQGFPFYDKPMKIAFAKEKSDILAKADGTYDKDKKKKKDEKAKKKGALPGPPLPSVVPHSTAGPTFGAAPMGVAPYAAPIPRISNKPEAPAPPNNVLFIQNLPIDTTSTTLEMLMQPFTGFKEVRMIAARPGIAFVEFESEQEATVALTGLNNFKITPTNAMHITYAKK